jgi:hypothetical protein
MKTLCLVFAVLLISCQMRPAEFEITYIVRSNTCPLSVSFENETNGTTTQPIRCEFDGTSSWSKRVVLRRGSVASVTAQIDFRGSGPESTIATEIRYGGQVFQRSESSGKYSVARAAVRME